MGLMWKAVASAMVLCGAVASAQAAREFTPQAGLWMIPAESNGQPGRGFSLDVQGNTAFLQVFNYEKSGAATFHTAVGTLDDAASMTAPLKRFKGGRYLAGPAQDAVEDGSPGDVTVSFTNGLSGTVQFPGESAQPIARFIVPEKLPFWWTQASDNPPSGKDSSREMQWVATNAQGEHYTWDASLQPAEAGGYSLQLITTDQFFDGAISEFACRLQTDTQVFDCRSLKGKSNPDTNSAQTPTIQRLTFRVLGPDIVGVMQPQNQPSERLILNGTQDGSFSCNYAVWCNGPGVRSARVYARSELLAGVCITGYCGGYGNITLLPTSGAWIIDEEKTGRPGRGVFLDVQDNTIIVQTSDYLANGDPTFHMGVGTLKSSSATDEDTKTSMPLIRYQGGRYFGGNPQSGSEAANAGDMQFSFAQRYSEDERFTDFATGDITLPGEGSKRIRRLLMETGSANDMQHMLGEYKVTWNTAQGKRAGWIRLTRVVNGLAMNDDGTVQCYQGVGSAVSYSMTCALLPTPNLQQEWMGRADIVKLNPFHRNVRSYDLIMRTRDRHGNWLGLGKVGLPGLAIPAN